MRKLLVAFLLLFTVCLHAQNTTADTSLKIAALKQGVWQKFLEKNIHPETPADHGARPGLYTVTVSFMVDTTGKVYDVKIEKDPGYGTAEDVLKAFKHSPVWPPATRDGQKVVYRHMQNINYMVTQQ
jgi:protein TonB